MEIRKLKDLTADEGLDFIFALSPAISLIMRSEFLRMKLLGALNEEAKTQRKILRTESAKEKGRQNAEAIAAAEVAFNNEVAEMITRDIEKIVPQLLKDYRKNVYEALAILAGCDVAEIKKQSLPWLMAAIWRVKDDVNLNDFLPSAGSTE